MSDYSDTHKTVRILILSFLMLFCAIFIFAYKVEACRSGPPKPPELCKEEFIEIKENYNNHVCSPGAKVEIVNSPPAPKAGIICRCVQNDTIVPSTPSASTSANVSP